ncbi:MAG: YcaQ family DNA glycosylase [Flavobacteriales bacterium]|nr:YcaQ family DNA glycosylase [Flavobacteriales bacterium]
MQIDQKHARIINLNRQGLIKPYSGNLESIEQIGYVQIDTISVTERSHNHVFYSRNKQFKPEDIAGMMAQKQIFEYWSHAAAYLPMRDFHYSLYRKDQYKAGHKHWFPRDKKTDQYVLDRIRSEGPLQSKDFENPFDKNHEWYQWKPAKIALTNLFMDGSLMIVERKGFQKVFDLTERVIPSDTNTSTPTSDEFHNHLIFNALDNFGITTLEEISYLRKGVKTTLKATLNKLLEARKIVAVRIENDPAVYYSTPAILEESNRLKAGNQIHILNPFDNLVIQRKRLKALFDFDYQIECYVPEKKRVYGYYTLPVLWGDAFVGRMDAKANRKDGTFLIKNIWLEQQEAKISEWMPLFAAALNEFAQFCSCKQVKLESGLDKSIRKQLTPFI